MPSEILMPALSPTMEEGTLARWLVKEGDRVESGQVIAEIETDKATMEFEAAQDGEIGKLLIPEGTAGVKVNSPIAILLDDGETAEPRPSVPAPPAASSSAVAPRPRDARRSRQVRKQTVREALRDAMAEEMRRDGDVFLIGEEVGEYQGAYKVSQGLIEEFGHRRIIDTPITEHGFAGLAVGAAFAGLKPIVEFMTFNFALQALDQIVNSAAKTLYMSGGQMNCPIVFRGPNGAAARVAAQHSHDFAALYAQIPGLKVVQPYSAADAKGLLKSAIRDPNPVVFLENEILYGRSFEMPEDTDEVIPIGKARVARPGEDVTIISFGMGMTYALEAADQLQASGISAEVVDLRSLRPIDYDTVIASVQKTNRAVTVESGFPVGSIGNHLSAVLMERAFDDLDAPVLNCTGKDVPMPYAANLERLALVSTAEVVHACRAVTYK